MKLKTQSQTWKNVHFNFVFEEVSLSVLLTFYLPCGEWQEYDQLNGFGRVSAWLKRNHSTWDLGGSAATDVLTFSRTPAEKMLLLWLISARLYSCYLSLIKGDFHLLTPKFINRSLSIHLSIYLFILPSIFSTCFFLRIFKLSLPQRL